jgi:hypothetical protein
MDTAVFAKGKIRNYQVTLSLLLLTNILITYVLFSLGFNAPTAVVVKCIVEIFVLIARIIFLKVELGFSINLFLRKTLAPICCITAILIVYSNIITHYINYGSDLANFALTTALYIPMYLVLVFVIALDKEYKCKIIKKISQKIK